MKVVIQVLVEVIHVQFVIAASALLFDVPSRPVLKVELSVLLYDVLDPLSLQCSDFLANLLISSLFSLLSK